MGLQTTLKSQYNCIPLQSFSWLEKTQPQEHSSHEGSLIAQLPSDRSKSQKFKQCEVWLDVQPEPYLEAHTLPVFSGYLVLQLGSVI